MTDTYMTMEHSDEDGSGPKTYNANGIVDFDIGNEQAEVREELAQIKAPIAQEDRRRRSGTRKSVNRAKKTGKNKKNAAWRGRNGYMSAIAGR